MPLVSVVLKCLKPKETDFTPKTLGEHIRRRRLQLGLSQEEAARRVGYCWTAVLNWEKGKTQPEMESISAIMAFLGYDPFPPPASMLEQLAALRRKNGWTIKQAARQLGIDASTWGRWEKKGIPWTRHRVIVAEFIQTQTGGQPHTEQSQGAVRRYLCPDELRRSMVCLKEHER